MLVAVLVTIILMALAAAGLAVLQGDDGSPSASGSTTTASTTSTTEDDDATGTTTTTQDDTATAVPPPLPGDDWNAAARTQFVDDCDEFIGPQVEAVVTDMRPACECAYDRMSQEVAFADFNAVWSSAEVEESDPTFQALMSAIFSCAASP